MTIEQAIKIYLKTKTEITSIVGTRLDYSKLPEGPTYPYLTFFRYSNPVDSSINLAHTYLQFDSWALTYIEALNLSYALRGVINREKNILSGIGIKQITFLDEGYQYEPDTKIHHVDSSYKVLYIEP
jgi:hypothetical protein